MTDTPTTTVADPTIWLAWRRPRRGRWQVVATGQTEREAVERLLDAMAWTSGGSWDSVVLPRGQEP
jgi:hypothetical protein